LVEKAALPQKVDGTKGHLAQQGFDFLVVGRGQRTEADGGCTRPVLAGTLAFTLAAERRESLANRKRKGMGKDSEVVRGRPRPYEAYSAPGTGW
jgi:hypothetical protein